MNINEECDITRETDIRAEGASSSTMPQYRNKKFEWHVAALFLFYLCEKGHFREKTLNKNVLRQIYNSDFKPEFLKVDPSSNSRDFPSFFLIIIMYLEKRLLLRMIGIESDVLHFHPQNVKKFLHIFRKSVLSKNIEENNSLKTELQNNENFQKGASRKKKSQLFIDQRFAFKLIEKFGDQVVNLKPVEKNRCTTCNKNFSSQDGLHSHYKEDQHLIRYNYQRNRKELVAANHMLQITLTNSVGIKNAVMKEEPLFPDGKDMTQKHMVIQVTEKDAVDGYLCLTLLNVSTNPITLANLLKIKKGFDIDSFEKQDENDNLYILPIALPKKLLRGASMRMNVKLTIKSVGRNDLFIFFKVAKESHYVYIMQKLSISVESEFTMVEPTLKVQEKTEWKKPVENIFQIASEGVVRVRGPKKKKSDGSSSKGLKVKDYKVPYGLVNLLNNGLRPYPGMTHDEMDLRKKIWNMLEIGLRIENYGEYFSLLLFIEHHQMSVDILKYRLTDAPLLATSTPSLLALDVPGLAEKRPSVLRGDRIMITVKERGNMEYEGMVQKMENTRVLLKFSPKLMDIFIPNMKVDVRFDFSRRPHNLQHHALEMMTKRGLLPYICFPTRFDIFATKPFKISWVNRLIETNERQKEAVINILSGNSRPAPYLLFGPPGTGKTVTVVEAMLQILNHYPSAHILIAAPSNAAVDVVSSRLLKSMPPSQLLRLYSPCREWSQVPEILQNSTNYSKTEGCFEIPKKEEILKYKVVAVTMITAGRIVALQLPINHFSHIFIDECAQGLEPEALITVAGLLGCESSGKKLPTGQLVLSGDPQQLGPVLRSSVAKKLGLEKSLLERLMTDIEIYQRDCNTNKYNPKVLTKLVLNFRSHPAILDLPNRLFYQGELKPAADIGLTHSACNWHLLPKKNVPIIFHGVEGREERDSFSPSYFNTSEIHQVVYYLREILNSKFCGTKLPGTEIGIISPYRRQVERIRNAIAKAGVGKDVSVASVEEFQGQERRVIIISTVRSDPQRINLDRVFRLGFLREPKRFNVAVTRAKALLIIIGNPNILQGDPCWGELLKYCYRLGCYTGIRFSFAQNESDEEDDEEEEEEDDLQMPSNRSTQAKGNVDWNVNSMIEKLQKLSVKANDESIVQKMIEPPWESHE